MGGPVSPPPHWLERGETVSTRPRSSSIRRMDGCRRRHPSRAAHRPRSATHGPDAARRTRTQDRSLYDQCITRGVARIDPAGDLQQRQPDHPGAGLVVLRNEMIHETRIVPLDGRPHVEREDPQLHGRFARPLGRRHAGRRDHEHVRRNGVGGNGGGQPFSDALKITERFTRVDDDIIMYQDDGRRSEDIHAAVHARVSAGAAIRATDSSSTPATKATTRS